MVKNPYSIFLMAQLAVGHGEIDKDLEYDLMWAEAQILLDRFESSKYNTESKSEIDCITDYLNSFKKPVEIGKIWILVIKEFGEGITATIGVSKDVDTLKKFAKDWIQETQNEYTSTIDKHSEYYLSIIEIY